jgi:rhodanese-related sulfurtransferase
MSLKKRTPSGAKRPQTTQNQRIHPTASQKQAITHMQATKNPVTRPAIRATRRSRHLSFFQTNARWIWLSAAIAVAVLVVVIISVHAQPNAQVNTSTSSSHDISVQQAMTMQSQGAFFLDVRQPDEWTQSHIQGATLIPLGDLPNRLKEVPKDKMVIVVCRTGVRAEQGRNILLSAGYTQVARMTGGITAWQAQGYPTVSGQ